MPSELDFSKKVPHPNVHIYSILYNSRKISKFCMVNHVRCFYLRPGEYNPQFLRRKVGLRKETAAGYLLITSPGRIMKHNLQPYV